MRTRATSCGMVPRLPGTKSAVVMQRQPSTAQQQSQQQQKQPLGAGVATVEWDAMGTRRSQHKDSFIRLFLEIKCFSNAGRATATEFVCSSKATRVMRKRRHFRRAGHLSHPASPPR